MVHARVRAFRDEEDEPATAQALSSSFIRALDCGASDPDEVYRITDLAVTDLHALARRQ